MYSCNRRAIAVTISTFLLISSFGFAVEASATGLSAPLVTVSGQGIVGPAGSTSAPCLSKYSPPGTEEAVFTFTNYQQGTEVRFRLFDSTGSQVMHVIDYVGANPGLGIVSQCNNLVVASADAWLSVTVPAGLMQIELIGIPNSFSNLGSGVGYFQSLYVSGAASSAVTVTQISFPASTQPPVSTSTTTSSTTTTMSPPVTLGSTGTAAITESPDLSALEPWSTNTIPSVVNCFSSQVKRATQATNFEFATGSQTLDQKEVAFRIQNSQGLALHSAVLYYGDSYCKTITANTSGSLKNWFQVKYPLVRGD